MASNNDFRVLLQAVLDSNSIGQDDINKIQKVISKYHLNLTADLDKASVIAEIKKIVPQLEAELKKMTGVDIQINDSALLKAFNQIEKQAESTAQKLNKIQLSLDDGTYQKQIISLRDGFASLSGNMESAEKQVLKVREAYNKMLNTDGNDKIKAEQEFKQILKQQELQLAENRSEAKKYIDTFKQTKLGNDIQKWLDTNTAATKEARKEMERYLDEVNQGNVTPFREKEIRSAIGTLTTQMRSYIFPSLNSFF